MRLKEIRCNDDERINVMKHAIGLKKLYHRHGKAFYKPYRNRFYTTSNDGIWNEMCKEGLAERGGADEHGREWFWLNRKGLDWLGNKLNITIHDEAD